MTSTLEVTADRGESITITGNFGNVQINGLPPDSGVLASNLVMEIVVNGGSEDNVIDLSGVIGASYTILSTITVDGADGDDNITVSPLGGVYLGGDGDDGINGFNGLGSVGAVTLVGGHGHDTISGGRAADSLVGDDGNDVITGGDGNDTISGGDGQDLIDANAGDDVVTGNGGFDTIRGNSGNDSLTGGSGEDLIIGDLLRTDPGFNPAIHNGSDTLSGSGDDDTLIGGLGSDRVSGRGGNDVVIGGEGDFDDADGDGELFDDLDGDGDIDHDDIRADIDVDTLLNDGEDSLFGNGGDDLLHGGSGDDRLIGGGGNDVMDGHDGDDTLIGNLGNDVLDGGRDNDSLSGGPNDDHLSGSFGDDVLRGQKGDDSLFGGPGADSLLGGAGNDVLEASVVQTVFLDFVSAFQPGDHVYLNEDLNDNDVLDFGEDTNGNGILDDDPGVIQAFLEADFADYNVTFTQTMPTSGDFATIIFGDVPDGQLGEVPFLGIGEASEIDFRNTRQTGVVSLDVTDALTTGMPPIVDPADPIEVVRQKFNLASAFVAAHEMGHLMGLRNADANSPLGINPATNQPYGISSFNGLDTGMESVATPVVPTNALEFVTAGADFRPLFPGPKDANESNLNLMSSFSMIDPMVIDLIANPSFAERAAVKLAVADTGLIVREQGPDNLFTNIPRPTFENAQFIDLRPLGTPNPMQFGTNSVFEFNVEAAVVRGRLIQDSPPFVNAPNSGVTQFFDDNDFYAFEGSEGEIVNIEINSFLLERMRLDPFTATDERINTMLRIFDESGRPVDYFVNRSPGTAGPFPPIPGAPGFNVIQFIDSLRTDSAVSDDFDDSDNLVGGLSFDGPTQDAIIINLVLPDTDNNPFDDDTFFIMVSEPFQRGIFALPADDRFPLPFTVSPERSDIVELDPITGVELNRFSAPVSTVTPNTFFQIAPGVTSPRQGGAAIALDASSIDPDNHVLYFMNTTLATASDVLFHLDPDDGSIINQVTLQLPSSPVTVGTDLNGMAFLNGSIFVADVVHDDILQFNPANGVLLNSFNIDDLLEGTTDGNLRGGVTEFGLTRRTDNFTGTFFANLPTPFSVGAPNGGPTNFFVPGSGGNGFNLLGNLRHNPGAGLFNQSPFNFAFNTTSFGDPDDIDISFRYRAGARQVVVPAEPAAPAGRGEGFVFGLIETATYGVTGPPPGGAAPGLNFAGATQNFGGIEVNPGDALTVVFDTLDNDGPGMGNAMTGDPDNNHFTVYLDGQGVPINTAGNAINVSLGGLDIDNNAFRNVRLQLMSRDSSALPSSIVAGMGLRNGFGTDLLLTISGTQFATFIPTSGGFLNGVGSITDAGREFASSGVGESRLAFWSNINQDQAYATVDIDNVTADFFVPIVREVTPGLAAVSQIPVVTVVQPMGGATNTVLDRLLIMDIDSNNSQVIHEINPAAQGVVTGSFRPNTTQGQNRQYVAIGAAHLTNAGWVDSADGLSRERVGTQVFLGVGPEQAFNPFENDFLVHTFNRGGIFPSSPSGLPASGFGLPIPTTFPINNAAPFFQNEDPVSPISLRTATNAGDPPSDPAFFLTPEGTPTYNVIGFGADDNVQDRSNLDNPTGNTSGNYELLIYKFDVTANQDNGVGNLLRGGSGNDTIIGSSSNDVIDGGSGDDSIDGASGKDLIEGGKGDDTLHGGNGDDSLIGERGVDQIFGDAGDDLITFDFFPGAGDVVEGGIGADTLQATTGAADDTIVLNADDEQVRILATTPTDPVGKTIAVSGVEELRLKTNNGSDTVIINDMTGVSMLQRIFVDFNGGFDLLDASGQLDPQVRVAALGGDGNDTLIGGVGRDSLDGQNGRDSITGGPGNDTLKGGKGVDELFGGIDDDMLAGGPNADVLHGEAGTDTLMGDGGHDELFGGSGADSIRGHDGNDMLFGEGGFDTLLGDDGNDLLVGARGRDVLNGGAGADTLEGGENPDTLRGDDGDDHLFGGAANDLLEGGHGNDHLEGGIGADSLRGGAGDDTLLGGSGADDIDGDADNDIIHGNDGADSIRGGHGDDTISGDNGNDSINAGDGNDVVMGGAGNDGIAGHDGTDQLNGGGGEDTLIGGDGDDTLRGGDDSDFLVGNQGKDNLDGQGGVDTLSGGLGLDTLTGVANDVIDETIEAFFFDPMNGFDWINQV